MAIPLAQRDPVSYARSFTLFSSKHAKQCSLLSLLSQCLDQLLPRTHCPCSHRLMALAALSLGPAITTNIHLLASPWVNASKAEGDVWRKRQYCLQTCSVPASPSHCLSDSPSVSPSVSPSLCLSVSLPLCLSASLSLCLSVCLSASLLNLFSQSLVHFYPVLDCSKYNVNIWSRFENANFQFFGRRGSCSCCPSAQFWDPIFEGILCLKLSPS